MKKKDQIIALLADGLTSREIGNKLKLSHRTIEVHIAGLKMVYGAKNTTHLVAMWVREKLAAA